MSESLTLITITMPSAPTVSYAPFQSQIVYLTTGDDHYRSADGVTFLGNTIEDIDDISNEIDISQGQGAFATSMHGTISFADSCDGGRLLPLILNGHIPLIGASVFIQSEGDLRYNPVTLYLQSPSVDSDGILSFDMYSAQYTKGKKLIKWDGIRQDKGADVGLVIGADPASIDTGKALVGRYQGVSVPTEALVFGEALTYKSFTGTGYKRNPDHPGAITYADATHPYDGTGTTSFCFVFPTDSYRDQFWLQYYGDAASQSGGYITPNTVFLVSDGAHSEVMCYSDGTGRCTYSQSGNMFIKDTRTISGTPYSVIYLFVNQSGSMTGASHSDIALYFITQINPICAGVSECIGFQSKSDSSSEYGTVLPDGVQSITDEVLYFNPTNQSTNGFRAWTELDNPGGFVWEGYSNNVPSISGQGTVSTYTFSSTNIDDIGTSSKALSTSPFRININEYQADGGHEAIITLQINHTLNSSSYPFKISNIYLDSQYNVVGHAPISLSSNWKWIVPFSKTIQTSTCSSTTLNISRSLTGTQSIISDNLYNSLTDLDPTISKQISIYPTMANKAYNITVDIYNIILYALTELAYGSNPAVVIPSAFPGTANLTNTPVLAINNLATFAGINAKSFVGSHTTYPAAWGRYIEPTANVNDTIAEIAKEAWLFVSDSTRTDAVAPDSETLDPIVYKTGNLEDVVTEPSFNYDMAGTEAQFTAAISHVDEAFSLNKGSSYFWSGWQEKDTVMLGNACESGQTITATGVLNDCIVAICGTGTLHCSFDGGYSWPVSQQIVPIGTASSLATVTCGNGVIVATVMNHSSYSFAYYSADYGRSWNPIATINSAAVTGGALSGIVISSWFDNVNKVLYLGGQSATGYAQIYMTTNGADFSTINIAPSSTNLSGAVYSIAVRGNPTSNIAIAVGITGQPALLASAEGGAAGTWYAKTGVPSSQHIQYFNGHYRIFDGNTMWSSENLIDWGSAVTTYSFSNSAESADGKIIIGYINAGDFWYSRDSGTSWQLITWYNDEYSSTPGWLWDDYRSCFICPTILHTTIFSVADPAVYQLWQTCRAAYLASGVINSQSYDWPSIYNADDIIDMLNVQDGIDDNIQARRIEWLCRQPRYLEMKVNYQNVGNQLSVSSGQRIVIPRQRLEDSGLNDHIPTYGIITSVDHNIKSGVTKLQIGMPPVTV